MPSLDERPTSKRLQDLAPGSPARLLDELRTAGRTDVSLAINYWKAGAGDGIDDSLHHRRRWLVHLPIPHLAQARPNKNELIAAARGERTFSHHQTSSPTFHQPPQRVRPVSRYHSSTLVLKRPSPALTACR
jgi:hypothetical protein